MNDFFHKLARKAADIVGAPWVFVGALALVIAWIFTGRYFEYSDSWQLVINTGTTIITFLIVFLLQNTQNHDSRAIHLKLDELIRTVKNARAKMMDLEDMSEDELNRLHAEFEKLGSRLRKKDA